ncbi:MAG: carbohydrate-binding domain-containing protein [Firmicutes bacterium]|nr:carbohydrate-binding domain-containing protein [Bacillota bacterium]
MKKTYLIVLILVSGMLLFGCNSNGSLTISTTTSTLPSVTTDLGIEDEYSDWDEQTSTLVGFNGTEVSSSISNGIQVGGTTVVIVSGGTYVLSGYYLGTIIINSPDEEVRLILNDLTIESSDGSAIICLEASKLIISAPEGTSNAITDSNSYNYTDSELMNVNAAIYCKTDLVINGDGSLNIYGNYEDGLKANDSLYITAVTLWIESLDDGISVNDTLLIQDGVFHLECGGDGIKVSHDDAELGYIVIQDGTFVINAFNDGIQASSYLMIHGGTFNIVTGDGSESTISSDQSSKGLKASLGIEIVDGTFDIDSSDDGLNSDELVSIIGGNFTISSNDEAIHSDSSLSVSGGEITIEKSVEGFEAKYISISGGLIDITSTDDGINGSDPLIEVSHVPSLEDETNSTARLDISGGIIKIKSIDDSIDVNGSIYQSGGIILINGPTNGMQSAIDYDLEWVITGGLMIAVSGYGAETKVPSTNSTQVSLMYNTLSVRSSGTTVSIMDSFGDVLYSFVPDTSYQAITISAPDLEKGSKYTLVLGGTITGELEDGYYKCPEISSGLSLLTMNLGSVVNSFNDTLDSSGPPRR